MKKTVLTTALGVFATVSATDDMVVDTGAGNNSGVEVLQEDSDDSSNEALQGLYLSVGVGGRFRKNTFSGVEDDGVALAIKDQTLNQLAGTVGLGYSHLFNRFILSGELQVSFAANKTNDVVTNGKKIGTLRNNGIEPGAYLGAGYALDSNKALIAEFGLIRQSITSYGNGDEGSDGGEKHNNFSKAIRLTFENHLKKNLGIRVSATWVFGHKVAGNNENGRFKFETGKGLSAGIEIIYRPF